MGTKPDESIPELVINWREVPSIYSDGPLAHAWAAGVLRIVMGELCFNTVDGADVPAAQPVANLVMTPENVRYFITYLQSLPGVAENET